MEKDNFILEKVFPPLDDLYLLLKKLQKNLNEEIEDEDYCIGRKQMYFTFLHETLHAFIRKKAPWVFILSEDEIDFIDELAVRLLIDDYLTDSEIFKKVDDYYKDFVRHRTDLKHYGFNLLPEDYDKINMVYIKNYSKNKDINGLCIYLKEMYIELGIKRKEGFTYKRKEE